MRDHNVQILISRWEARAVHRKLKPLHRKLKALHRKPKALHRKPKALPLGWYVVALSGQRRGSHDNKTSARCVPDAPCPLRAKSGEPLRVGIGFRKRLIYTCVRMLKTRSKTCHFLPLFARGGDHRAQKHRDVCRIDTQGSGLSGAWLDGPPKKWQIHTEKWHMSTSLLFTMSRRSAENGNQDGGAGVRRLGTSRSRSRIQDGDVRLSHWSGGGRSEPFNA